MPESFARLATLREKQSSETEELPRESADLWFRHDPEPGQIIPTTLQRGPSI